MDIADSVTILGEKWRIALGDEKTYPHLKKADGDCDVSIRQIVVKKQRDVPKPHEQVDLRAYERLCVRHEIVHAFLFECGLGHNSGEASSWATNEEMVDWIARQHGKLHRAFVDAGAYDGTDDMKRSV